jgi:hypothetical protein
MDTTANGQTSVDKDSIEEKLTGDPLSTGYRPTLPLWALWSTEFVPQIYLMRDIELMMIHPMVTCVLNYYKGGIAGAEFDVVCQDPAITEFVQEQCKHFWDVGVPFVQGGYEYGWIGCENMYVHEDGQPLKWDHLIQFSPRDAFLLTQDYNPVGVRVKSIQKKGRIDLWLATDDVPAKALWYPHNPRYNRYYGQSQLQGAWRPWRRLAWRDGAETVIDTGIYRFAFCGPQMGYPEEDIQAGGPVPATTSDSQGRPRRFARDVARQIAEWAKTGAGIGLPTTKYPAAMGGGDKWTIKWPEHTLDTANLINHAKYLHDQICYGIGVPPELLQSAETGSGYSGRNIPLEAFIQGQQRVADAMLAIFKKQVLKPLVRWNFGAIYFDVKVHNLLESKLKMRNIQGQPANQPGDGTQQAPPSLEQQPGAWSQAPQQGMGAKTPQQDNVLFSQDTIEARKRIVEIAVAILGGKRAA